MSAKFLAVTASHVFVEKEDPEKERIRYETKRAALLVKDHRYCDAKEHCRIYRVSYEAAVRLANSFGFGSDSY